MDKTPKSIHIFKRQNQVIFTYQNQVSGAKLIYESLAADQQALQLVGLSSFVLNSLQLSNLNTIKIIDDEAHIIFEHSQILKLKILRQT